MFLSCYLSSIDSVENQPGVHLIKSDQSCGINGIEIFGSYNESSIGDTLILLGLVSAISSHFGSRRVAISVLSLGLTEQLLRDEVAKLSIGANVDIEVIGLRSSRWRRLLASLAVRAGNRFQPLKRVSLRLWPYLAMHLPLPNCQVAIFGGGNLLMDLFPLWPHITARLATRWLSHSIPYIVAGVGAGPINAKEAKTIFSDLLQNSNSNIFRDSRSRQLCEHALRPHVSLLAPDFAFAISPAICSSHSPRERRCLGVNFAGVYGPSWPYKNPERYRDFLHGVSKAVSEFSISNDWEVKIIVSNLSDVASSRHLESELLKAGVLNIGWSNYADKRPSDMIDACASCKVVVAVRLHACIASALAGAIPIGIIYQPKVRDVLLDSIPNLKTLELVSVAGNPDLLKREISFCDEDATKDLRCDIERLAHSSCRSLGNEIKKINDRCRSSSSRG
jgi:polysaccharide pyruvyl transferase WcaK-like protein